MNDTKFDLGSWIIIKFYCQVFMLSVIIPVYNLNHYLNRCLDSILSQSVHDLDVILIDDGSVDGSAECCEHWQRQDRRVRCFHQSNAGVSSARNLGLEHAHGDFITFVDGDDYIKPGMYECMLALQAEYNADTVICGFERENADGSAVPNFYGDGIRTLSQQEQVRCLLTNTYFTCSCWDKIFYRKILEGIRFNQRISHLEDLLFCYEAMKKSDKAVFTSEPFYRYCDNEGNSAARQAFGERQMTMLEAWDYIYQDATKNFPFLKKSIQVQYYRNYIMCSTMARQSAFNVPRIRRMLRRNIYGILLSTLAAGYKLQALRNCI